VDLESATTCGGRVCRLGIHGQVSTAYSEHVLAVVLQAHQWPITTCSCDPTQPL
jgi:hypothetical protein